MDCPEETGDFRGKKEQIADQGQKKNGRIQRSPKSVVILLGVEATERR